MRSRSVRRAALAVASLLSFATACADDKPKAPSAPTAGAPTAARSDPAKARELMARGALVVDVREAVEWDSGHLPQARHIPAGDIGQRLAEIEQAAGGKDRPIVLHCASGRRSGKVKTTLEAAGFTNVVNGGGYGDLVEAPPAAPTP